MEKIEVFGYNFKEKYSSISDADLDMHIRRIKVSTFKNCGERIVEGILRSVNVSVQRHRIRESLRRIEPIERALRWPLLRMKSKKHGVYNVAAAQSLWHIDGLEKLQRWRLYIHGGIDGYSRVIVYLLAANNKLAKTVLDGFLSGVQEYGIPSRVRSDFGKENTMVAAFMLAHRGDKRGSHIVGSSIYNQRIERLHQDTFKCCVEYYRDVFMQMECQGLLNPDNPIDIFCLHYVYLPRINYSLTVFRQGWNEHRLQTERNLSPNQLWLQSVTAIKNADKTAIRELLDPVNIDYSTYGVETDITLSNSDAESNNEEIPPPVFHASNYEHCLQTLQDRIDPLAESDEHGVDIYTRTYSCVKQMLPRVDL
ncbi:uncharacterized protein [Ptychodera flava]|uniref:uncharacterized protein n=1 Tax=Ptychodera flava TaxID=63121 RepID=UPI003969FF80